MGVGECCGETHNAHLVAGVCRDEVRSGHYHFQHRTPLVACVVLWCNSSLSGGGSFVARDVVGVCEKFNDPNNIRHCNLLYLLFIIYLFIIYYLLCGEIVASRWLNEETAFFGNS